MTAPPAAADASIATTAPTTAADRLHIPDVLRGIAILGILTGNMQWFSGYGMMPDVPGGGGMTADAVTEFLVHVFAEGKFYSVFSFLFGWGFALQIAKGAERGDTSARLFKRRLWWLLAIGLLHAYLLWAGDILSIYAGMGFLLLLFRNKPDRALLRWAFALMLVPILSYLVMYLLFVALASADTMVAFAASQQEWWDAQMAAVQGSYVEIITGFNLDFIAGRYAGLIGQMRLPKILAMFLLGLYAYRRGYLHDPGAHAPLIRRVLLYGGTLGLAANVAMAALSGSEAAFPPTLAGVGGVVAYAFGVPALALFYAALVVTLWQKRGWQRVLAPLAPVGRMALTNYLTQSLVCTFIFYGYGLGKFGTVGATAATLMAVGIFAVQVLASGVWLSYFRYGPVEWVWRRLTYRQRLPMRLTTPG